MYTYAARLVGIVDGDTVRLDLDLGFYQWRLGRTYRLGRIDAPELNADAGKLAKTALTELLAPATAPRPSLLVTTSRADSFDRWIVELFADGRNASDWLVANGHAVYRTYS